MIQVGCAKSVQFVKNPVGTLIILPIFNPNLFPDAPLAVPHPAGFDNFNKEFTFFQRVCNSASFVAYN